LRRPPAERDHLLARSADDLARIRAVARRKRLLRHGDVGLELGCAVLERRLAAMTMETAR
jgi:hypothetical protein